MNAARVTDPDILPAPPEPPQWSTQHQAWVLSSYADVQTALRLRSMGAPDPRGGLARIEARTGCPHPHVSAALDGTMLFQTDPRHAASRGVVRTLLAAASPNWTAQALQAEARAIVAALADDATLDAATGLADLLPCRVLGDILGLAPELIRHLGAQSRQLSALWRPMPPLREYARLEALCEQVHADLQRDPPCLRGASGHALDYPIADLVLFLAIAGVDTTASTIATGLDLLARNRALQARLRAQPALIGGFVAETLRLVGPVRRLRDRVATAPAMFSAVEVPAGCALILQIDRAHRDPAAYPDPHCIDPTRRGPPLAAFGGGAHVCQGAALGQAQVAAVLAAVLERCEIAPAPGPRALLDSPFLHKFETLPLRLTRLPTSIRAG